MKIINDKGMLFGKINIIDFLVVVFILCLMPMFYFGYKIMTKPIPTPTPTITLDRVAYEQEQTEHERLKAKRDNFLREHKRARKYF